VQAAVEEGVPAELARGVASLGDLFAALDIVGVASATERSIDEVAALHFLIGGRGHLHWLRDQIATLPRENRWQAMARAALRDDLFSLHAELTADVLRGSSAEARRTRRRTWIVGSTPTGRWSSAASASSAISAPAAPTTSRRCRWRCASFAT
jgi:glutamate dehydrogenase